MSVAPVVIGQAVLLDFPLRLWARQQEHSENVLREFQLIIAGERSGTTTGSAPRRLIDLAQDFTQRFGPMLVQINAEREAALASGRDRLDSYIPIVEGIPRLIAQVRDVLAAVDDYCLHGDMLTLARPGELVALMDWSINELIIQYAGGTATAWPGPF